MVKKALLDVIGDAEVRLLRIFRSVVECGGFSAAELELDIGRSTVSRHIKDLESRLGVVLCRRGRAGFALTPDGEHVYQGALQLFATLEGFHARIQDLRSDLGGRLSVGLFDKTASNPEARIGEALRRFRAVAPAVRIDLAVDTIQGIEAGVLGGRFHLGIAPSHRRSPALAYHDLFGEDMFLYCGKEHPLFSGRGRPPGVVDLQGHDFAGLDFHSPNMEAMHRFGLRRQATANDQEAIATLVLSGRYIGFLPDHYAASFVRAGTMRGIAPAACSYRVRFVAMLRRSAAPSRVAGAFLQALRRAHESRPLQGERHQAS